MLLGISQSCNVGIQQMLKHATKGPGRASQCVLSGLRITFHTFEGLRFLFTLQQNAIDLILKIKNATMTRHLSARRSDSLRGVHYSLYPLGLGRTVPRKVACLTSNIATKSYLFWMTSTKLMTNYGLFNVRIDTQAPAP